MDIKEYVIVTTITSGILSLTTFIATHSVEHTLETFVITETLFMLVIILLIILDLLSRID